MTDDSLGHILSTARHGAGRSLRAVAVEVGMAPSYLLNLEQGKIHTPSPRHLKGLADALGLEYVDLMRAAGYHMPGVVAEDHRPPVPSTLVQELRDVTAALTRVSERFQALRQP